MFSILHLHSDMMDQTGYNKQKMILAVWEAAESREGGCNMSQTVWSLVPPVVTIILALATKEVYMSLAIGIFIGAFMFAGFSVLGAIDTMFKIMSDKVGSNVYIL